MDFLDQLIKESKDLKAKEKHHSSSPEGRITAPSWEARAVVLVTRAYACTCGNVFTFPELTGIRWEHPKLGTQIHNHERPDNWTQLPKERKHLPQVQIFACEACFENIESFPYLPSDAPRAGVKLQPVDVLDLLEGDDNV